MELQNTAKERTKRILWELRFAGQVSVDELSQRIGVSPSTVRRDLQDLEVEGLLRRTHGGAVIVENLFYEPFRDVSSFHLQEQLMHEEKRRIGLLAAELISDGDTISICAGTTTTQVARSIRHRKDIKIFTNSVNIAMELSHRSDLDVVLSGGSLSGEWFALVGPKAIQHASEHFVDKVFVGVDGFDAERGITDDDPAEAAIHNAMLAQARQRIVVADHTKLGKIEGSLIWPARGLDVLVTDSQASDQVLASFRASGVDIRMA